MRTSNAQKSLKKLRINVLLYEQSSFKYVVVVEDLIGLGSFELRGDSFFLFPIGFC
jgi:hypothetical protein